MAEFLALVYTVNSAKRRHHLKGLRPCDVDVAEAKICFTEEETAGALRDFSAKYGHVMMLNLNDAKAAASLVHVGMVAR